MKKFLIAAICFAAIGPVVAQAQEAPINSKVLAAQSSTTKAAKPAKQIAAGRYATGFTDQGLIALSPEGASKAKSDDKKEAAARKPVAVTMTERGQIEFSPGVDPVKTSSVASARPNLVLKERNSGGAVANKAAPAAAKAAPKGAYGAIIARYAAAYGVPVSLAHAVIRVESNYRPNARGSAGEIGLMQIKPATARGLGYSGSAAGLFNPETNIKFGMKYLGMAHKLGGGSTCGTILKYNAGHGAKRMNPVSANYCAKVKRHLGA